MRAPPVDLNVIRDAALVDLEGPQPEVEDATPVIVQNLLRHAMSEAICDGIVNIMAVTNSNEANIQLTRIHEHIFNRKRLALSLPMWLPTCSIRGSHCRLSLEKTDVLRRCGTMQSGSFPFDT